MSSSSHQIQIKASDKTAGAFSSIKKSAAGAASSIKGMLGGALAAAGAYLGARSIVSGINELGTLSDIAQRASTSVDELTQAATAMSILGIKDMGVDQLATAFQRMEKATGQTGLQGFYSQIRAIGQIQDQATRASTAMETFGRAGLNMMPLINAADQSTDALKGVIDAMPKVSQAAADAGDAAADAMAIAGAGVKSIWLDAIGYVVRLFTGDMSTDIRSAMAKIMANVTYYVKVMMLSIQSAWRQIASFSEKIGSAIGTGIGTLMSGGSLSDAWRSMKDDWQALSIGQADIQAKQDAEDKKRIENWSKRRSEEIKVAGKLGKAYAKAAKASTATAQRDLSGLLPPIGAGTTQKVQISNALVLGNTAQALKMSILGPQSLTNRELKKQTDLLKKINDNTKASAQVSEAYASTQFGELN